MDNNKLKILEEKTKYQYSSKKSYNELTNEELEQFNQDIKFLQDEYCNTDDNIPLKVLTSSDVKSVCENYNSVIMNDTKLYPKKFKKDDDQRLKNISSEKRIDNIRYAIGRAFNLSSTNIFPCSYNPETNTFGLLDRGNFMEWSVLNLPGDWDSLIDRTTHEADTVSKKEILSILKEFLSEYETSVPTRIVEIETKIKKQSTDDRYKITNILNGDEITRILSEVVPLTILIADNMVGFIEMANFNSKGFDWYGILYLLGSLNKKNNLDRTSLVNAAIKLKDIKKNIGSAYDKCPEMSTMIALAMYAYSTKIKKQLNKKEYNANTFPTELSDLIFALDKLSGDKKSLECAKISKLIGDKNFNKRTVESMSTRLGYVDSIINHAVFTSKKESLKELSNIIDDNRENTNEGDDNYAQAMTINSDNSRAFTTPLSRRLLATLTVLAMDEKMIINMSRRIDFAKILIDELFGSKVFKIKYDDNQIPNDYTITDTSFRSCLTGVIGNSGRAEYIAQKYFDASIKFNEMIKKSSLDPNNDNKIKECKMINTATNRQELVWYSTNKAGDLFEVGMRDGKPINSDTSWAHLDDKKPSHDWNAGALQLKHNNSSDGNGVNISKIDHYRKELSIQEDLWDDKQIQKRDYRNASSGLNLVIDYLEKENN